MIYLFDGSMEGLLCAVFEFFERKPGSVSLRTEAEHQPDAFSTYLSVHSDPVKANRVWKALQKRLPGIWIRRLYACFLSEKAIGYSSLFEFCCYLFVSPVGAEKNYGNEHVLTVAQLAKKVEREKHRMEAFIRFQHTSDGLFYCGIDPDYNVLPLIMKHFKDRYADQKWIIYDIKRHYGLFYNLEVVEEIRMKFEHPTFNSPSTEIFSEKEELYQALWKDYFKSTNIPARKNTKLHLQHVPKRYWKYLTEKQPVKS
ncbi:TIGR03915 family putative DNA repair protein [Pedobacter caeni]|uniref:Probable DNA metabolism protein n=1 Tax=Pedobacter caeni TaxID=288992 RepID=A0A1M5L487_9SPHI|nr:TIGR03915 family putative DNA repair protein [Pedobacter caeni]SHG59811.1 probable DNA metabolism protein [Pedobacter caeni]